MGWGWKKKKGKLAHAQADKMLTLGKAKYAKQLTKDMGEAYANDWLEVVDGEIKWAADFIERGASDYLLLDTETTSVNDVAEVVELALVRGDGTIAYETFVRPIYRIAKTAENVHGINNAAVLKAPEFAVIRDDVQKQFDSVEDILIYNAEFDTRLLQQSCYLAGVPEFNFPGIVDVMLHFSRWAGVWKEKHSGYAWFSLESGHRAAGDCIGMLELMKKMASLK